MITKEQAFSIIRKEKPNHKITTSYEFPDKFAFIVIPKDVNPDTFICNGTFVMKKDGRIEYGIPTVDEMKHAIAITEDEEIKHEAEVKADELVHHGVSGMKWGKRNGPPYPLNAEGKTALRKQRMSSYGSSVTKGAGDSGRGLFKKKKSKSELDYSKMSEEEKIQAKLKAINEGNIREANVNKNEYTYNELQAVKNRFELNSRVTELSDSTVKTGQQRVNEIASKFETASRLTNAIANTAGNGIRVYNSLGIIAARLNGTKFDPIRF